MIDETLLEAEEKMDKAVSVAKEDFTGIRTGRATPAMFNKIVVEYYGTMTPVPPLKSKQRHVLMASTGQKAAGVSGGRLMRCQHSRAARLSEFRRRLLFGYPMVESSRLRFGTRNAFKDSGKTGRFRQLRLVVPAIAGNLSVML